MNTYLHAGDYALDKTSGLCYQVTTDTVQTLGRRQCRGLKARPESSKKRGAHSKKEGGTHVRITESNLIPVTGFESDICYNAECIYRAKQFRSESDRTIVMAHKVLLDRCGIKPTILEKRYSGNK